MLFRVSGCALNAKSIERLCHYYGQALEAIADKWEPEIVKASAGEPVYVMVDGTMLFTPEEGWKEMK